MWLNKLGTLRLANFLINTSESFKAHVKTLHVRLSEGTGRKTHFYPDRSLTAADTIDFSHRQPHLLLH